MAFGLSFCFGLRFRFLPSFKNILRRQLANYTDQTAYGVMREVMNESEEFNPIIGLFRIFTVEMRCCGMNHLHRQEPKELRKVNHSRDGQSRNVQFVAAVDHSSETSQGRKITLGQTSFRAFIE